MNLSLNEIYNKIILKENHSNHFFFQTKLMYHIMMVLWKKIYITLFRKNIRGSIVEMEADQYMAICAKL